MTRHLLSNDAAEDLAQLVEFLLNERPEDAVATVDLVVDALKILNNHPLIGRPVEQGMRELVISRGRTARAFPRDVC